MNGENLQEAANGRDPLAEKVDRINTRLSNIEELLEEVLEKLADLQTEGYNSGYSVD